MMIKIIIVAVVFLSLLITVSARGDNNKNKRGGIPTEICDVTSLSDLVELQSKVDYARIACEGGRFVGFECSRYWMLNNELVRKKLTFEWCRANKRETFRNWAGTETVVGEFKSDFLATLQKEQDVYNSLHDFLVSQHNITITQFLSENAANLLSLKNTETTNAEAIRINTYSEFFSVRSSDASEETQTRNFDSASEEADRSLVHSEESNDRTTVDNDAATTRSYVHSEFSELRSLDSTQEQTSRDYFATEQSQTRTLISTNHDSIREEMDSQASQTRQQWLEQTEAARVQASIERAADSASTVATDVAEETSIRNLVSSTEAANVAYDAQEEDQTRDQIGDLRNADSTSTASAASQQGLETVANITATADEINDGIRNAASSSQSSWNSGAANTLLLLASLQSGSPEPRFTTFSMHFDLILSYNKGFPAVNLYTDNLNNFMALRSLVNETISYNSAKYGNTANIRSASSYWTNGETQRTKSSPDYRKAVENYSAAYVYATTPNNNSN